MIYRDIRLAFEEQSIKRIKKKKRRNERKEEEGKNRNHKKEKTRRLILIQGHKWWDSTKRRGRIIIIAVSQRRRKTRGKKRHPMYFLLFSLRRPVSHFCFSLPHPLSNNLTWIYSRYAFLPPFPSCESRRSLPSFLPFPLLTQVVAAKRERERVNLWVREEDATAEAEGSKEIRFSLSRIERREEEEEGAVETNGLDIKVGEPSFPVPLLLFERPERESHHHQHLPLRK